MTIEELGSIGEFIASIGVVVSLVYLALQTRANTQALKSQTRSSITDQVLTIQTATFMSQDYRAAALKSQQGEPLSDSERDLLSREALMYFKHMENAQYQYDSGLHDEEEYGAQKAIWELRFTNHPFWREAWEFYKPTLSPRLVGVVQPIVDGVQKGNT